jgi:zinc-ribbon domain
VQRYCPNCGTEVDETAAFCPTCGQPIDQVAEAEIPAAPAWPDSPRERSAPPDPEAAAPSPRAAERFEDPTRVEPAPDAAPDDRWVAERTAPPPPPRAAAAAPPTGEAAPPGQPGGIDLPITWPVTLSAWLIGGGALVGAVGLVVGMFRVINAIDLLILLVLIAIAITVFFSASVPAYRYLRLATLVAVLIGFGIAIDRIGFGLAGIGELLLFLGTAAAAIGAILLEIGQDQPLGGTRG